MNVSIAPPQTTHFIAFYSFKGGVGRTMALLNAAHYLAAAGLDVLMIDADLEAPGLTLAQKRSRRKEARGFIALYEECRGFIEGGAEPEKAPHKLAGYLHSLTVKTPPLPEVERPGRLALLPAHPSDASADAYLRQLGELSIREVVAKGLAVHVAEVIRARELLGGEAAVQIPYHPRIALIEEPFVVTRPDHHVTEQYRKAARAVLALVGDDPETHLREATRLVSEDKIEESLSRLRRACPFAKNEVIQVLRLVITQTILARGDVPPWGDDAFLLLTRLDPQDDIAFNNWGNHLTRLAEMVWKDKRKTAEKYFRDAEKRLREAVSLAPEKEA